MRRVRLAIPTTYHPDAGGSRRQGEVFDLSDELGNHWVRNGIADAADGEELTAPLVPPEPDTSDWYPKLPELGEADDEGAVLNSDNRPAGTALEVAAVGLPKRRRGRQ